MDDPAGLIVMVLIGILAIFMVVRLVTYASRTVDREQSEKAQAEAHKAPQGVGHIFCPKCGKGVTAEDVFCRHCGVRFLPEKSA